MPFVETYSVDFANGNLHPHVNRKGWPAMQVTGVTENTDLLGRTLSIFRYWSPLGQPSAPPAVNSVVLAPPGGLLLNTRLFMRVMFDRPNAEPISLDSMPPPPNEPRSIVRRLPGDGAVGGDPNILDPGGHLSIPEPWAVALNISDEASMEGNTTVHATCQFNRVQNGVRLTTPALQGVGGLQTDRPENLESPLNYRNYEPDYVVAPGGTNTDVEVEPPIFVLEHSFCGWNIAANTHTVGTGFLKIYRIWSGAGPRPDGWPAEVADHRVYSNNALPASSLTAIGAVGVSLVTLAGVGRYRVRLRKFELWFNPDAYPARPDVGPPNM